MNIETLPVGPLQANCYLLSEGGDCLVIDPGGEPERLLEHCRQAGLQPSLVLLTHGHVDHIAAACGLKAAGATVLAHEADHHFVESPHPYFAQLVGGLEACHVDGNLEDGQQFTIGDTTLTIVHTPGHSLGGVCLLGPGLVFTGDTLFAGSVGRTDLPGGDWDTLAASLKRLIALTTPDTVIYPGHGPASTVGEELQTNPFLQELD